LLIHPDRFSAGNGLWLDCPGDEYSPIADGQFESYLYFYGQILKLFYCYWISVPRADYGSVVAFSRE